MNFITSLFIEFIMAVIATGAFAVLYNSPRKQWFFGGLTGGCGWVVYRLCSLHSGTVIATFFATLVITFLARVFAIARKTPVLIFLVSGIFPLVPGVGIYYTAYYFIMNDFAQAGAKGVETLKIALSIALGIMCIFSIPQKLFLLLEKRR